MKMRRIVSLLLAVLLMCCMGNTFVGAASVTKISTLEQLYAISEDLTGNYELTENIEIPASAYEEGGIFANGFLPIGLTITTKPLDNREYYTPTKFEGTFDGKGHTISGLVLSDADMAILPDYVGLFAQNEGTIQNLILRDVTVNYTRTPSTVDAHLSVGTIVAQNNGTVSNCAVLNATVTATRSSKLHIGGIAGSSYNMIRDCYFSGTVTANNNGASSALCAGGIVGSLFNGTVTTSLTDSTVTATGGTDVRKGSIYGRSAGVSSNNYAVSNLTAEQLKTASTFKGFDFNTIWLMENTAPMLRIVHTHSFRWITTSTTHRYACATCPAIETGTEGEHINENNDEFCDTCGYNFGHVHDYATAWESNETNHWHECKGSTCIEQTALAVHSPSAVITFKDQQPTCGASGKGYTECTVCKRILTQNEIIPATGDHAYDNACDASCNICNTPRTVGEHKYDNACDTDCNICFTPRTITHSYGEYVYNNDATYTADGTKTRTCKVCGNKETVIAANTKLSYENVKTNFTDVKSGAYYETAVSWAVVNKVTTGTTDTTFSPDNQCTRGQIVTFLWRAAGSPKATTTTTAFTDIKKDSYYYDAVLWAVEKGITTGTSATAFSPNSTCTRGQIVTFLWRFWGEEKATVSNPFSDTSNDAYYAEAMLWAVENGITTGTSANKFSPANACTRGQCVTFLYRSFC